MDGGLPAHPEEPSRKREAGSLDVCSALRTHSQTPFEFRARDGRPRFVKFRLIPEDRGKEDGLPNWSEEPWNTGWTQGLLPGETRGRNDLKDEYRERVARGPVTYHLQLQLHEQRPEDTRDTLLSCMVVWDEATHPWMDLATVSDAIDPDASVRRGGAHALHARQPPALDGHHARTVGGRSGITELFEAEGWLDLPRPPLRDPALRRAAADSERANARLLQPGLIGWHLSPGYDVRDTLAESRELRRAARHPDPGRPRRGVKTSRSPTPEQVARLTREFEMARRLSSVPGVIEVIELLEHEGTHVMVMEDIGGESLDLAAEKLPSRSPRGTRDSREGRGHARASARPARDAQGRQPEQSRVEPQDRGRPRHRLRARDGAPERNPASSTRTFCKARSRTCRPNRPGV